MEGKVGAAKAYMVEVSKRCEGSDGGGDVSAAKAYTVDGGGGSRSGEALETAKRHLHVYYLTPNNSACGRKTT